MDEKTFRNTKINDMMGSYGESNGGGSCSGDFGNELVKRWRNTRRNFCKRKETIPITSISSIDCFLVFQTRHHGNGDNLCLMNNISMHMGIFGNDKIVRPIVKHYVDTRHADQPYVHFKKGFLEADCEVVKDRWREKYMPGWNVDVTVNAFSNVSTTNLLSHCNKWISHNILLIQRDTFANFFHDSEDFINAFLSMAILEWKLSDTQLYFTDLYPEGPFWYYIL
jgi:hypothetical protein